MKKTLLSLAMMIMALSVFAQETPKGLNVWNLEDDPAQIIRMSSNGKYVCGNTMGMYNGVIISTETGEPIIMETTDEAGAELSSINNSGIAVGYDGNAVQFDINGDKQYLPLSEGALSNLAKGISDNNIIVGSEIVSIDFEGEPMQVQMPVYWKDGKLYQLPVPTAEDCAGSYLEELMISGAAAQFISADGSVIVGIMDDIMDLWPMIIWRLQEDGSYAYDLTFAKNFLAADGAATATPYSLSANGKYAGCLLYEGSGWAMTATGAIYNIEENTLTTIESDAETGTPFIPFGIADNSFAVGAYGLQERTAAYLEVGESTATLLAAKYADIEMFTVLDLGGLHSLACVSADGNLMAGFGMMPDWSGAPAYLINRTELDESIAGVQSIAKDATKTGIYTLDGIKRNDLTQGVNIVIENGAAKKVFVK